MIVVPGRYYALHLVFSTKIFTVHGLWFFFLFALFYFFGIRDYLVSQDFVLTGFIACLVVIIIISCIPMKSDFGVKVTPGSLSRSKSRQRAVMDQWIEEAGS